MEPPPDEEIKISDISRLDSRISQITSRLSEMGCSSSPVECPEFLMEFEQRKCAKSRAMLDAVAYQIKMDKLLDQFRKSKEELISKVKELEEKGVEKEDIYDYIWKEDVDGTIHRFTIKIYYDVYNIAVNNLLYFLEYTKPMDGKKLFEEKNELVGEKIDLLVQMRQLELDLHLLASLPVNLC